MVSQQLWQCFDCFCLRLSGVNKGIYGHVFFGEFNLNVVIFQNICLYR